MTERPSPSGDPAGHLFLTVDFKPLVGGVAEYLHGLAAALSERGSVEVVAYGVEPSDAFDPAYDVRHLSAPERVVGRRWGDAVPPLRRLNTALYFGRLRADAPRALQGVPGPGADRRRVYVGVWSRAAHWWCRRLRKEAIPYGLFTYGRELRRDPGPIWRRRRRADVRGARRVFACSEATATLVRDRFGGELEPVVVYPGISGPDDLEVARDAARRLRRRLEIPAEARILATVGRLVRRKGVHRVLESLASGGLDDPGIHYVVGGEGPERKRLESRVAELGLAGRVRFLGHVDEATKWAIHALADVFVMPSGEAGGEEWEGFGIVFLEAAVLGVPSVAARSGGAAEAVAHGRTGLVVEPGSVAGLREALLELLSDEGRRREMGRRARERALREFTWERAAGTVLAGWRG